MGSAFDFDITKEFMIREEGGSPVVGRYSGATDFHIIPQITRQSAREKVIFKEYGIRERAGDSSLNQAKANKTASRQSENEYGIRKRSKKHTSIGIKSKRVK